MGSDSNSSERMFPSFTSSDIARIHCQNRPGNVTSLLAKKIIDAICDIHGFGHALQCAPASDLLALNVIDTMRHFGIDKTGRHGVDSNPKLSDLTCQGSRETDQR